MECRPGVDLCLVEPTHSREIVNLAAALDRVGGDSELLEEIAKLFLETAPRQLDQIRQAVADRDALALSRSAHTLKGSVGTFGADAAFEAALRLEKMGRSGELAGVDEAYAALEEVMQGVTQALLTLGEKHPQETHKAQ
ncbi:MAG TPA: Hpt domain-containing protein [Bryobacterales bacterium]|nr:Hpt domain-containing protein [Bryobacterales bacterium]